MRNRRLCFVLVSLMSAALSVRAQDAFRSASVELRRDESISADGDQLPEAEGRDKRKRRQPAIGWINELVGHITTSQRHRVGAGIVDFEPVWPIGIGGHPLVDAKAGGRAERDRNVRAAGRGCV